MKVLKLAAHIAWGGRRKDYGELPVQPTVGYTNAFGIVPIPSVGLRFGDPNGSGLSVTTAGIGINNKRSRSFKERSSGSALLDHVLNKKEDKETKNKKKMK